MASKLKAEKREPSAYPLQDLDLTFSGIKDCIKLLVVVIE